jgi:hypothetical protein
LVKTGEHSTDVRVTCGHRVALMSDCLYLEEEEDTSCEENVRVTNGKACLFMSNENFTGVKIVVFWVLTPLSHVILYHRFGRICCLHDQNKSYNTTTYYRSALQPWVSLGLF